MKIISLAAAVPKTVISADCYNDQFGPDSVRTIVKNTGVLRWRKANADIFTSDLAYHAAESIFNDCNISRYTIDALLFITQGPDSLVPSVSPILQKRLNLRDTILSLDITAGCSGYVDGLLVAHSLIKGLSLKRILILNGDTSTKSINQNDKSTALLFGDAAAATVVECSDKDVQFVFGTDGHGSDFIKNSPSLREYFSKQNAKEDFHVKIDGPEIFNFTIKRVPKMITSLIEKSGWDQLDIDAFVFHQANSFILKHLLKKIKIHETNAIAPMSLENFGNTSSASIPLTMVTEMNEFLRSPRKLILVGFGVGLSWSSMSIQSDYIDICKLVEV